MRILLLGATGMLGQGVLEACLAAADVERVVVVGRTPCGVVADKLTEVLHADFLDLSPIRDHLAGLDACFCCLGVSSVGLTEDAYRRITVDVSVAAARAVLAASPGVTFCFISGLGSDDTGTSRAMWRRVKGEAEHRLRELGFATLALFRPGFVQPVRGARSKTRLYRIFYLLLAPLGPLLLRAFPRSVTTTERIGHAMLAVAREGTPSTILAPAAINRLAQRSLAPPHAHVLTDADHRLIEEVLANHGSGWAGGVAALERAFEVRAQARGTTLELALALRALPGVRFRVEIDRARRTLDRTPAQLPRARALTTAELARCDEVLAEVGELWLVSGEACRIVDVRGGLGPLAGDREVATRWVDAHAVFYLRSRHGWGDTLCVWLDLDRRTIAGACTVELPMADAGRTWLSPDEVAFLDRALVAHGDFGTSGNVQDGLRALVTHMDVQLRERDEAWAVSAYPRDGHGHFLHFEVRKGSGEIGACAAGHLERPPDPTAA